MNLRCFLWLVFYLNLHKILCCFDPQTLIEATQIENKEDIALKSLPNGGFAKTWASKIQGNINKLMLTIYNDKGQAISGVIDVDNSNVIYSKPSLLGLLNNEIVVSWIQETNPPSIPAKKAYVKVYSGDGITIRMAKKQIQVPSNEQVLDLNLFETKIPSVFGIIFSQTETTNQHFMTNFISTQTSNFHDANHKSVLGTPLTTASKSSCQYYTTQTSFEIFFCVMAGIVGGNSFVARGYVIKDSPIRVDPFQFLEFPQSQTISNLRVFPLGTGGNVATLWQANSVGTSLKGARLINNQVDGALTTLKAVVNDPTVQYNPDAIYLQNRNQIVTIWEESIQIGSNQRKAIFGQLFTIDLIPTGEKFQISHPDQNGGDHTRPMIIAITDSNGLNTKGFIIQWHDSSSGNIIARRYDEEARVFCMDLDQQCCPIYCQNHQNCISPIAQQPNGFCNKVNQTCTFNYNCQNSDTCLPIGALYCDPQNLKCQGDSKSSICTSTEQCKQLGTQYFCDQSVKSCNKIAPKCQNSKQCLSVNSQSYCDIHALECKFDNLSKECSKDNDCSDLGQNIICNKQFNTCEDISAIIALGRQKAQITQQIQTPAQIASLVNVASATASIASFGLVMLSKALLDLRYIDIQYSHELIAYFKYFDTAGISLGLPLPETWEDSFSNNTIPDSFAQFSISSSFFINYWDTFSTLLIVTVLGLMLTLITWIIARKKQVVKFQFWRSLTVFVKFNLLILLLCGSLDEITLFSYLELNSKLNVTVQDLFSVIFAISFAILGILLVMYIFYLVQKFQSLKRKAKDEDDGELKQFIQQWDNYQVLFKGFKQDKYYKQCYMSIFIIRAILSALIISTLIRYPKLQCLLLCSLTLVILVYDILMKPFLSRWSMYEIILYEIIILGANLASTLIAFNPENSALQSICSQMIVICFMLFSIVALLFLLIGLIIGIKDIVLVIRSQKGKLNIMQIITLPFQVGGVDFAEMENYKAKKLYELMKQGILMLSNKNQKIVPFLQRLNRKPNKKLTIENFPKDSTPRTLLQQDSNTFFTMKREEDTISLRTQRAISLCDTPTNSRFKETSSSTSISRFNKLNFRDIELCDLDE